jgi:hypothetical protein
MKATAEPLYTDYVAKNYPARILEGASISESLNILIFSESMIYLLNCIVVKYY